MVWRFQKRVRIATGVTLSLSKSGVSLSAGPRDAKVNISKPGTRVTTSIPGTGRSRTDKVGGLGCLLPAEIVDLATVIGAAM